MFDKRKANTEIKIYIDNVNVKKVHEAKFLGVTLHQKICWKTFLFVINRPRPLAFYGKQNIFNFKAIHIILNTVHIYTAVGDKGQPL